jgi:hypothetical protein
MLSEVGKIQAILIKIIKWLNLFEYLMGPRLLRVGFRHSTHIAKPREILYFSIHIHQRNLEAAMT